MRSSVMHSRLRRCLFTVLLFVIFLTGNVPSAVALDFRLGPDMTLDMDIQLKYDAAWRLGDPNPELDSSGNQNFKKGDMWSNRFSTIIEIDFRYKQVGLFARPRAYYDFAYNDNDDEKFPDDTLDLHRHKLEVLDAFAYAEFDLAGQPATLRVGRQVVNWGESAFITNNIATAQNPIDVTALISPDVQLKEVYLPSAQVMGQLDLWAGFSIAGYYQFEWVKTRIPERGSYFSSTDLLDDAGHLTVPGLPLTFPQRPKQEPKDQGQYGVALRYMAEWLNYTEFGFYFINYHEKAPNLVFGYDLLLGILPAPYYFRSYPEDIELYGFSFSTQIGQDWAVSGELSYRQDFPVPVASSDPVFSLLGLFTYADRDVLQVQFQVVNVAFWNACPLWENLQLIAEVGFNQILDHDDVGLVYDDFALSYVVMATPTYYQILPALDLSVPITFVGNPYGDSSILGTAIVEHSESLGVKFNFTYRAVYEVGLGYTARFGGPGNNVYADRDHISVTLKYTF